MLSLLLFPTVSADAGEPEYSYEKVELIDEDLLKFVEGGVYDIEYEILLSPLDDALRDVTAPDVRLWVVREGPWGGVIEDHLVTDEPLTLVVGTAEHVALMATANEPDGGLRLLDIVGESTQTCISSDGRFGQSIFALWAANNGDPDPTDDDLYPWMLTAMGFPMPPQSCQSGYHPTDFEGDFYAVAENLAGQTARTASVTIVWR